MIISAYVAVAGLADMGYRFYTTAEVAVAARITAGIVNAGNGWYSVDATIPSNAASVRWDSTGTPEAIAREYFNPIEAASFVTVNTKLDTVAGYVDTEVASILSKVNALPPDPADASDIAASFTTVNNTLATISGYIDTEVAAIKAKTDQLTFTTGKVNANATTSIIPSDLNAIADTLLTRDWNSITGEPAYSALNAFRVLRNVWNTAGGTLSVKKEDGTTTAWIRTLTTNPSADPITGAT